MPRRPDGNSARRQHVTLRVDDQLKALITRLRGPLSESEYVRRLILQDAQNRLSGRN